MAQDSEGEVGSEDFLFEVPAEKSRERLDRFLPAIMQSAGHDVSRAVLQGWIKEGAVLVNGGKVKPRYALSPGDEIFVRVSEEEMAELLPEAIEIEILYEDNDIIVVNKQHGLVVHPGAGNQGGTLVNALLYHCKGHLCDLAGDDRPGIVHRLDKDTSGCLVAAKSVEAYRSLVSQFSGRETGKTYIAVVSGVPKELSGTLATQIGRHPVNRQRMAVLEKPAGKEAITDFRVLRQAEEAWWATLECVIHTGRTHQIRVHMKECLQCPILGDPIYGQPKRQTVKAGRLMLHAQKLELRHPLTGKRMEFEAPIPSDFDQFL